MKKGPFIILGVLFLVSGNALVFASLSASLGATKLDGLEKFTDCQKESHGYRETLIADRLELKLANTGNLPPAERALWSAEIAALRAMRQTRGAYQAPNPKDPQHYMLGLTDKEQQAINSISIRFMQEVNLKCEQLHGGMLRYSPTSDQSGQKRFEDSLRAQMGTPLSLESIPVEPLPRPEVQKTPEELAQERLQEKENMKRAAGQMVNQCLQLTKGLRPRLIAQTLQKKLDSGGIAESDRAAVQADIQAAWASAGKGMDTIESADPTNPFRAEQRLSPQELMEVNTQYSQQITQSMQSCAANQRALM